jgi:Family of unknown function (DUF5678)
MIELALSDETVTQVRKMAAQIGEQPETLVERAVRQYLRAETQRAIHREAEAFRAQHAELLSQYPGRYVAMVQGRVVDDDLDQEALLARVEGKFPDLPVLIAQVLPEPEETYTARSPRWESGL